MKVPGSKIVPRQGVLGSTIEMHRNILKNLLLHNYLALMLEICYVALPSGPLPILFKCRSQGPRWILARGCRFEP